MLRLKRHLTFIQLGLAFALLAAACGGQTDFTGLTAEDPVAELPEGLTLSVNPASLPDNFGVNLAAIPAETFAAGEAGEAWAAALAALPSYLRLHSAIFTVQTEGDLPEEMFLSVIAPAGADLHRLDLYAWDGAAWSFLPAQARGGQLVATVSQPPAALALFENAPLPPLTLTTLEPGQTLSAEGGAVLNAVLLGGVLAQADGSLGGQVPGVPLDQSFAVLPVVRNHAAGISDPALLAALLSDDDARANHLQTLAGFVVSGGYDGVVLDYAGVTPEQSPAFAQFVADLAGQLRAQNKSLFVQVEAPVPAGDVFQTGGYDWRALGAVADALIIPMPTDPASYGNGAADRLLAWAVGEAPRARLRLLTTALSVESANGDFALLDPAAALVPLGGVTLDDAGQVLPGDQITVRLSGDVQSLTYDEQAYAASYAYTGADGAARTLWLTSAGTLRQRLALAEKYRLGGVAVNDLMAANVPADMLAALNQYRAAVQAEVSAHAELLWTVRNEAGIIALATAQPGEPYVYVAPVPGEYQFSADLQHGGSADLGAVAVQVAQVTPTPSPEPSATTALNVGAITPASPASPAPTSAGGTPAPTATSKPSDGGVFVPPPPIGAGTFELGGQVPGFIGNLPLMQQAHMRWVKFQCKPGCDYAGFIAAGKGAGFKVLLSAVGDHGRSSDPAYFPEYAAWVAGMSAAGADAIEVWNEANLDREWANGHINGANYAELLKQAYNAIKGSGGAMVISGAPAPTGAAGAAGCIAALCNDDVFLQQMANAGAANYMDCVGVHYNTGTTSPNATTGSALSGYHYSYYFWPMIDLYWGAFGGTRPLCFTELGYLTSEGYGGLSPYFAWAADNTVAEQAQWLAEAASLAGNSGQVRLMIVFNVDFTHYSDDPQAGYAMRRPDGSCPACGALGAVVP